MIVFLLKEENPTRVQFTITVSHCTWKQRYVYFSEWDSAGRAGGGLCGFHQRRKGFSTC